MKINGVQSRIGYGPGFVQTKTQTKPRFEHDNGSFAKLPLGNIYGVKINKILSFGGNVGKRSPILDFYYISSGNEHIGRTNIDYSKVYECQQNKSKKWAAGYAPSEILKMYPHEAIEMLVELLPNRDEGLQRIYAGPISTPNYGNNWGRHANYIEINPRALGKMEANKDQDNNALPYGGCSEGILGAIKMLNLIPPSSDKWANCVILSQIVPNIFGDGWNKPQGEENSLYTIKINPWHNYGLSENLIVQTQGREGVGIDPREQIIAFNDLAHLKGLKTGFRMYVSEDQIKIGDDIQFKWDGKDGPNVKKYIDLCVDLINMGFDAIYFDSARHVDHYDWKHYAGVGETPDYDTMAYITHEIRQRTKRNDICFIGEKCDDDIGRYQNMGLTAGTDYGNPNDFNDILNISRRFKNSETYAPGPEVSNDNDEGGATYETRLERVNSCLFGYDRPEEKLPTFMQMHDLYPLNHGTNTHNLMKENPRFSSSGNCVEHWNNLFAEDDDARNYSRQVNEKFANAIR